MEPCLTRAQTVTDSYFHNMEGYRTDTFNVQKARAFSLTGSMTQFLVPLIFKKRLQKGPY